MKEVYAAAGVSDLHWVSRQRVPGRSSGDGAAAAAKKQKKPEEDDEEECPGPAAAVFLGSEGCLGPWLCDPLLRTVCESVLDPHLRLAQLDACGPTWLGLGRCDDDRVLLSADGTSAHDGQEGSMKETWRRSWRASWPHDLADRDGSDGGAGAGNAFFFFFLRRFLTTNDHLSRQALVPNTGKQMERET
eukprot:COSAG06_NODE_649_length_13411_cov_129.656477_7_plen_189_part_00